MEQLFAVCAPGLELYTAMELEALGLLPQSSVQNSPGSKQPALPKESEPGGVSFTGDLSAIYLANLQLRTASRVLLRLGDFHAAAFSELRKKASRLDWGRYLRAGQPVSINVTCRHSRLYHSDAIAERIVGSIGDCLGQPPPFVKSKSSQTQAEDDHSPQSQLIVVRLVNDQCAISLDSSGDLLHRRGYRLATAKAPLRETLAAGMLFASGWDRNSPLLDPFCGSGTISIEAAMLALGVAPGRMRRFAFMEWPGFQADRWAELIEANACTIEQQKARLGDKLPIFASDRDAGAVEMSRANAARMDMAEAITFACRAVSAIEPKGVGWVVTNPPYGLRVSPNHDLRNLYAQFGKVLKVKCPEWRVAILCNDFQLIRSVGLELETSSGFVNGGVPVRLARGVVRV